MTRDNIKSARTAASPLSVDLAKRADDAFTGLVDVLDRLPAFKNVARDHVVNLGGVVTSMISSLDNVHADLEEIRKQIASLQQGQAALQQDQAATRMRVVTDELERRAVATARRSLKLDVGKRLDCTFYKAKADAVVLEKANSEYNSWLPEDNDAAELVRDARDDGTTAAHVVLGSDVTIIGLLQMNKLAKGTDDQRSGWPAISALQTMREHAESVAQPRLGGGDRVMHADDPLLLAVMLSPEELNAYIASHAKWHLGCTCAITFTS